MTNPTTELERVLELVEKATPGEWFAWDRGVGWHIALDPDGQELLPDGMRTDLGRAEDAAAIAAAVNFLREHGRTLLEAMRDAERLDFLDQCREGTLRLDGPRLIPAYQRWGGTATHKDARAAIDAARQQENGDARG